MRPLLDGSEAPYRFALTQREGLAIEDADDQMREERRCQLEAERKPASRCPGGITTFHIDAYGQLQPCSNNRQQGYDLRQGSFHEGFYEVLPRLACADRATVPRRLLALPVMLQTQREAVASDE